MSVCYQKAPVFSVLIWFREQTMFVPVSQHHYNIIGTDGSLHIRRGASLRNENSHFTPAADTEARERVLKNL